MASPYDKAQPYLQKQPEVYHQNLDPYINRGNTAGDSAASAYNAQTNDPGAYLDKLFSSYNPSKGWDEFKNNELMRGLKATAAHGGYAGTPYDQEMQGRLFNDLLESDRDKWIERVLGLHTQGLEGETHFADQGQAAGLDLTELLGNNLNSQATLAFQSEAAKQKQKADIINALIQGGGAVLGGFAGGPGGAALGSKLGGYLGGKFSGNIGGGGSLDSGSWNAGNPADFFGVK